MFRATWCIALCLLLSAPGYSDQAEELFNAIYKPKIAAVTSTRTRTDDVTLAKEMLSVARISDSTPQLQKLLCDAVYDLTNRHVDGYSTAIESLQFFASTKPDDGGQTQARLVETLTRASRVGDADARRAAANGLLSVLIQSGDDKAAEQDYTEATSFYRRALAIAKQQNSDPADRIMAKLQMATMRVAAQRNFGILEQNLLRNASDSETAEAIVKLCLIELDDPPKALPLLSRVKDTQLKQVLAATAGDAEQLDASQSLAAGSWYASQLANASLYAKATVAKRAETFLNASLSKGSADTIARKKAQLLLADVQKVLADSPNLLPDYEGLWVVIFRSSEPLDWNTEQTKSDNKFAMPLAAAPDGIQYLRMRRMDTLEAVIIPMTKDDVSRKVTGKTYVWSGDRIAAANAHQFGIGDPALRGQNGNIWISNVGRGWGFGHVHGRRGPTCGWAGKRIDRTVFEISVRTTKLSKGDQKLLR